MLGKTGSRFLSPLSQLLIRIYIKRIGYALPFIPYKDDLGVTDLLTLKPVKQQRGKGEVNKISQNSLVEAFREHEKNLVTDRKGDGYDSEAFGHFLCAIKAIAAFNGIFHLHEDFNRAYVLELDKDRTEEIKALKKRIYSLEWIDKEIERLLPEYYRIIDAKSFHLDNKASNLKESRRNLRFCLFFITLLTLRFMGYRQQNIRSGKVGENITVDEKGVVTLKWKVNQTKNKKGIITKLSKSSHGYTHEILIEALLAYDKYVYPYLCTIVEEKSRGHFFLHLARGKSVKSHKNAKSFHMQFTLWAREFLNLTSQVKTHKKNFNPHHLRGLCTDWLVYVLNMSLEDAAKIIADSVKVLERKYLDKNRPVDGTPVLDKYNRILKAEQETEKMLELQNTLDEYRKSLTTKDHQINALFKQLSDSNKRRDKLEAEKEAQAIQIGLLQLEIATLR